MDDNEEYDEDDVDKEEEEVEEEEKGDDDDDGGGGNKKDAYVGQYCSKRLCDCRLWWNQGFLVDRAYRLSG